MVYCFGGGILWVQGRGVLSRQQHQPDQMFFTTPTTHPHWEQTQHTSMYILTRHTQHTASMRRNDTKQTAKPSTWLVLECVCVCVFFFLLFVLRRSSSLFDTTIRSDIAKRSISSQKKEKKKELCLDRFHGSLRRRALETIRGEITHINTS